MLLWRTSIWRVKTSEGWIPATMSIPRFQLDTSRLPRQRIRVSVDGWRYLEIILLPFCRHWQMLALDVSKQCFASLSSRTMGETVLLRVSVVLGRRNYASKLILYRPIDFILVDINFPIKWRNDHHFFLRPNRRTDSHASWLSFSTLFLRFYAL